MDGKITSPNSAPRYRALVADGSFRMDSTAAATGFATSGALATQDFTHAARLGVTSYPTLLLHTPTGVARLGSPTATTSA